MCYDYVDTGACRNMDPVGISDISKIPDSRLTASSQYGTRFQPAYGRLNGNRGDGWCAKKADRNDDWLQVDLGKTIQVCAVATQGDRNGNEWTTDFKLSYSSDGNSWTTYKNADGTKKVNRTFVNKFKICNLIENNLSIKSNSRSSIIQQNKSRQNFLAI